MGDTTKRVREDESEDLGLVSHDSKRGRLVSPEPLPSIFDVPSEPVLVQPDARMPDAERVDSDDDSFVEAYIPDNLLDILDDAETAEQEVQDLDSVIKSFEEEINAPPTTSSDSGESKPDLGYLLVASDDELGLPPTATTASAASDVVPSDNSNFPHIYSFQDEIPSYESFGLGDDSGSLYTSADNDGNEGGELVFDGLFDSSDFSEFLYKPESMPAS